MNDNKKPDVQVSDHTTEAPDMLDHVVGAGLAGFGIAHWYLGHHVYGTLVMSIAALWFIKIYWWDQRK